MSDNKKTENPAEFLADFLKANSKEAVNVEGAFCTGFLLAAEYMDAEGNYYTYVLKDETVPPWRLEGLLNYVVANEIYDTEEEDAE